MEKDYDHVRNLTLLFFLDRLLDKDQPRTLHDLSCQFGTKGFSKEMRQIAGGSQSGLRKFLEQFPSLFTLDGDYVTVTNYKKSIHNCDDPTAKVSGIRDYDKEAIEYFVTKLNQYGPSTEVPIKSLLGHRSQAPPEVRHVSGQHIKEFQNFLQKFPDVFVIRNEAVILKEYENLTPKPFIEHDLPLVDSNVRSKIIEFCTKMLAEGSVTLESLFQNLVYDFSMDIYSQVCRTSSDLGTFLRMHSNIFNVQSNMVRLAIPVTEVSRNEIICSNKTFENLIINKSKNFLCNLNQSNCDQSQIIQNNSVVLCNENTKPYQEKCAEIQYSPLPLSSHPIPQLRQTLKSRVNSILVKAIADNSERDRVSQVQSPHLFSQQNLHNELDHTSVQYVQTNTKIIVSIRDSRQVIHSIYSTKKPVSVDAEGVNLGSHGPITLLQIGTYFGSIYIFDLIIEKNLIYEGGLKELLESPYIVKVCHDCRAVAAALYNQFNVSLKNVFDTQAAHGVLQHQESGRPVYKVKNVSLNTLCRLYEAPLNPRKEHMKNLYRRDNRFWSRRPLSEDMIIFAAFQVFSLVPTIFDAMNSEIKPDMMPLLNELCSEQIESLIDSEKVKQKKKLRKINIEVTELKEKLSKIQNKNVVLSNREIRLLRYLELTEEEKEKLEGSYKVARKLERLRCKNEKVENSNGESDDDRNDENEFQSLSSGGSSGSSGLNSCQPESLSSGLSGMGGGSNSSEPPSLADSMAMVDQVLSDGALNRYQKIDQLEAILAQATEINALPVENSHFSAPASPILTSPTHSAQSRSTRSNSSCCCQCHLHNSSDSDKKFSVKTSLTSPQHKMVNGDEAARNVECQTMSTGDIVITKVYYPLPNSEKNQDI